MENWTREKRFNEYHISNLNWNNYYFAPPHKYIDQTNRNGELINTHWDYGLAAELERRALVS